jgi:N-acyl-phosphatidylethanolamine-hydrolysing phospholipase D
LAGQKDPAVTDRCLAPLLRLALLLLLAGCTVVGGPVPGAPSHHREYGFANPNGARGAGPAAFLLDRLRLALGGAEADPAPALERPAALAAWAAAAGDAAQWLGHATVRLRLGGTVLLVDPVFGAHVTPLPPLGPPRAAPPPVTPGDLADVDAILLTHDHYDHFEPTTVDAVAAASGAACLAPLKLADADDLDCPLALLDWGQGRAVGQARVTLLRAQHESGRGLFDRDHGLWGAWQVEAGGRRVYVMGDSGYGPHFAAAGQAAGGFDLAILNLGGYEPRAGNHAVHLEPAEAIRALIDLGAERALIVHWGTYPLGLERIAEMRAAVARALAGAELDPGRVVFLAIGEVLTF